MLTAYQDFWVPRSETCCASSPKRIGESKRLFQGNGRLGAEFALVSSLAKSLPQLRKAAFSVLGTVVFNEHLFQIPVGM